MLVNTGPGWRWCYYSYLIMMGCAAAMQFFFYNPPSFQQLHGGKRTIMEEVKRIDFIGAFLLTSGLALFLLGISWGTLILSPPKVFFAKTFTRRQC
jgi:Fungal trichothecene efflux pump (TRI12)